MLDGVNDQPEHARQLIELVRTMPAAASRCKFNLIPFNPFPASGPAAFAATRGCWPSRKC